MMGSNSNDGVFCTLGSTLIYFLKIYQKIVVVVLSIYPNC